MKGVVLAWSGGKDSLMALEALEATPDTEVRALITTVTDPYRRISMHGVRETLLDAQAEALGLPLVKCRLPSPASNEIYRARFAEALRSVMKGDTDTLAFGDLFLEDVRAFREEQTRDAGYAALFPIWGTPTRELAARFVSRGHQAILCCVDGQQLGRSFLGREFNAALLDDLPSDVDPCGENGEFHTFLHGGPRLSTQLPTRRGATHVADGRFHFVDLN